MLRLGDESGTVMVEYALVLALLSVAFIAGLKLIEFTALATLANLQQNLLIYGTRVGNST